jgi:DNA polymerase elongation subunit (family B)
MTTHGNMFVYSFHVDKKETECTAIRIYGLDNNNKSVCLRVNNFTPFVMIELPKLPGKMKWTKKLAEGTLATFLEENLRRNKPLRTRLVFRKKLYSSQTQSDGSDNKFPFLFCNFAVKRDVYALKKLLYSTIKLPRIHTRLRFKLHESNADEILQLACTTNITTCGWLKYSGKIPRTKVTLANREVCVPYNQLGSCEREDAVNPLILSFDIEAYSHSPGKFPDAEHPDDKVFMISCVFFRDTRESDADFSREVLLTLGNPRDEDVGAECIRFRTEGELLEGFANIIREMSPQIITGWNILGFDIEYMIKRSKITNDFDRLGLAGMHKTRGAGEAKEIKWKSSAYKNQEFQYLDWEGRVIVDLLPVVRRDHKLDNYKLDTVGKHFLGGVGKDDLSPKELFKCYEVGIHDRKNVDAKFARDRVGVAGKYCMVDSRLVAHLFRKTQAWVGLSEMAATCNVPMFELIVRGQQKRVFAQVYKYCSGNGIVVESEGYKAEEDERYVGAYVFEPVPGVYNNIVPFDFASLYPTTIIAYNIDYSTLVQDRHVPDSDCHVIEWEDHLGCCHDPKVQRLNDLNTLINSKESEMKKLRTKRDTLTVNSYLPGYIKGKKYTREQRKGASVLRDRDKAKINRTIKRLDLTIKPYREERSTVKKGIPKLHMCAIRKYRFLKEPKGVIPTILQNLLDARANTRKIIKTNKKVITDLDGGSKTDMEMVNAVLHQRQLAYKICSNSMYGAMGVREGYLPFMPGAMCTTAMGRRNNKLAAKTIVDKWKGTLVYGDTDSEYLYFPHITGETQKEHAEKLWDYCLEVAEDVTKLYPPPMKLEFEEEIYRRFLILSKKRYMYKLMKRDGVVQDKVGNKGVLLSRRDNSNVVRDLYAGLVQRVFDNVPLREILDWVFHQALAVFRRQVPIDKFTITKAVGGVGNLPLLTGVKGINKDWIRSIETGAGNKSPEMLEKLAAGKVMVGDYTIPKLSKQPIERARQLKLKQADDDVGYYTNSLPAHVSLAMKMRSRGIRVDDGTRLEHLVTFANGHTDKLFSKVEDVAYFKRHSEYLKIDNLYYIKAMTTPVDQVLTACFGVKHFMKKLYKHWIAREKLIASFVDTPVLIFE